MEQEGVVDGGRGRGDRAVLKGWPYFSSDFCLQSWVMEDILVTNNRGLFLQIGNEGSDKNLNGFSFIWEKLNKIWHM